MVARRTQRQARHGFTVIDTHWETPTGIGFVPIGQAKHPTNVARMPPLATDVVDDDGTAVLEQWITGLTACP